MAMQREGGEPAIIELRDFGARPDSGEDATGAFARALEAARSFCAVDTAMAGSATGKARPGAILRLPAGRLDLFASAARERTYPMSNTDVLPSRRVGILVEGLAGLRIEGAGGHDGGTSLVLRGAMSAIACDDSEDILLSGLVIDTARPCNAEARVLEASPRRIVLRIDPEVFPFVVEGGRLSFETGATREAWRGEVLPFDPETSRVVAGSGDGSLGAGRYAARVRRLARDRIVLDGLFSNLPSQGEVLVLRHGGRSHAGIYLQSSRNLALRDIEMRGNSGLGVLAQDCDGLSFERVRHIPAPGRFAAGHDDGLHIAGCRGLVRVEDCEFRGLMDDPINVHGASTALRGVNGRRLVGRFMHGQSAGLAWARPGDRVALLERGGLETLAEAKVASFRLLGRRDFELLLEEPLPPAFAAALSPRARRARSFPSGRGLALENRSAAPDVEIRRCLFLSCRARGLLLSTPGKALVEDSRFESSGAAILVAGDANNWWESGPAGELVIRGCDFSADCNASPYQFCKAVVSIRPSLPKPGKPFHGRIEVTGNRFRSGGDPVLYALSARELEFSDNLVQFEGGRPRRLAGRPLLWLDACGSARIRNNRVDPVLGRLDRAGARLAYSRMDMASLDTDELPLAVPPSRATGQAAPWLLADPGRGGAKEQAGLDPRRFPILSPPSGPEPRINAARVFGARPGSPILFRVATSGERPMHFSAEGLPAGLALDPASGLLTGKLAVAGNYEIRVRAENAHGLDEALIRLEIGGRLCLTPPMGWSSWYVDSLWVSQETVARQIEAMDRLGLADHGWTFVNLDDAWQGRRDPGTGALLPNAKFPDMAALARDAHGRGLKLGIYSTPWLISYAGYAGGSSPDPSHDYAALALPGEGLEEENQVVGPRGRSGARTRRCGAYMGDADARQWEKWGIDYLKYDWYPNDVEETGKMRSSLDRLGRDVILSLSNNAPFESAKELSGLAQLWRTTGDLSANWSRVSSIGFSQARWAEHGGPGHWNDPDMLVIGRTAKPHRPHSAYTPTALGADEQYSQVSLWCLLSAPLILSCDLASLESDPFTLALLTNPEVIAVDQDPAGKGAKRIRYGGLARTEIWTKELEDGSLALGAFNRGPFARNITIRFNELGLEGGNAGSLSVRDLWRRRDLGRFEGSIRTRVARHGVALFRISR